MRKYSVNENYFSSIDTEEKAYWLGFLTADGSIKWDRYHSGPICTRLQLGEKDAEHIIKFIDCIGSSKKIEFRAQKTGKYTVGVDISSTKLASDLDRLGLVRNKTINFSKCPELFENLEKHYWRGVFDGDGSINSDFSGISFICHPVIVSSFIDFVTKNLLINPKIRRVNKVDRFNLSGENARKFLDLLYTGSSIYLQRKYEAAIRRINRCPNKQEKEKILNGRIYAKSRREKDINLSRERERLWYQKNIERERASNNLYRRINRERICVRRRELYRLNKGKLI